MDLEKITKNIKRGVAVFGLVSALTFGTTGIVQAQEREKHFFTCEGVSTRQSIDFFQEDPSSVSFPDDYSEIKDSFDVSEPLILVCYNPNAKIGDIEKMDLLGPKGKIVDKENRTVNSNGVSWEMGDIMSGGSDSTTQYLFENGGCGDYKAVWYLNNNKIGENNFSIKVQKSKLSKHFFACNSKRNNDCSYPEHYIGIKTSFTINESLIFVNYDPSCKAGDVRKVCFYGPNGRMFGGLTQNTVDDADIWEFGTDDFGMVRELFKDGGGYGGYKAVWYLNDKEEGETYFLIDNPKASNKFTSEAHNMIREWNYPISTKN